jgi:hypothetical protein
MFDVSPKLINHQFGFVSFLLQVASWIPNLLRHDMFCYTL